MNSSTMAPISKKEVLLILIVTVLHRSSAQDNSTVNLARTNFLIPKNCADPLLMKLPSGVRRIQPQPGLTKSFEVYCDQKFDKGGWTVFQNRFDGSVDFFRGRAQYEEGFGDLKQEFWLGLRKLNQLTYSGKFELAVLLSDWDGNKVTARYSLFKVAGVEEEYALKSLGSYSGDAGDSLSRQLGMKWTTMDKDLDTFPTNCATRFTGAWWYINCHDSNLNGVYFKGMLTDPAKEATVMTWRAFRGQQYGLKTSRMMIRPVA